MNAVDIRKVLMVQAIEESDEGELLVTAGDKREAATLAGAPLSRRGDESERDHFLVTRAESLISRILTRHPEASPWLESHPTTHFGLITFILAVVAAIAGFLTNELGPEKRINILSFPLLGIILWSLLVYLRELVGIFPGRNAGKGIGGTGWLGGLLRLRSAPTTPAENGETTKASIISGARYQFENRWQRLYSPVTLARVKATLHATAFILAASAIGGMYLKGLANEYRAVWESTFFTDSAHLRPFLQLVLGPAVSLSGGTLPGLAELDAIHWQAGKGEISGENAARWIHWYALTIGLFVLIPRALLTVFWHVRSIRLGAKLPFLEISHRYFERLLATSTGTAHRVHVVPYAFEPDSGGKRALIKRLEDQFGQSLDVTWETAITFGDEEDFSFPVLESEGELLLLFNFGSTPEVETHLAVYRTLSERASHPLRYVLLDATAFDRKSTSFAEADERREGRENAWKKLFQGEAVSLIIFPDASSRKSSSSS